MRRHRLWIPLGVFVLGFLGSSAVARAECLPCVYVENSNPYVYVEVCPPVR